MAEASNPSPRVPIPKEAIADFCQRHHIPRFAFVGSVLRADFGPKNNIDSWSISSRMPFRASLQLPGSSGSSQTYLAATRSI